jgi:2-polyprenyl-3-methyl-5-hydroxy-6-metoxy-1,4-benzoquinol methylase
LYRALRSRAKRARTREEGPTNAGVDPRARAYFDARAQPFDRLYDPRPGLRGRFQAWVYGRLRWTLERTLAELGELHGTQVLDIGCGSGRYAVALAERGADVLGVDLSPAMLALARERAEGRGVSERCRFVEADFDGFQPDGRFDVVLLISVLEYRNDLRSDLARLHELTREKAIVNVPRPHSWQTIVRRVRHRLRPSPPSLYVHSPASVAASLEEVGFDVVRSERGWFVAAPRGEAG